MPDASAADAFPPDLRPGDTVVHRLHGIGRLGTVATLDERGFREDLLEIAFAGDTRVWVPADAIGLVHRHHGAGGRTPKPSTIGGRAWKGRMRTARAAAAGVVMGLVEEHARRIAAGGIAFPPAAGVERFLAGFPHRATSDQEEAWRAIADDLARPVAMDRLLCGDVGFGKTELAMRAAFVAVAAGYQAAVLAPTTVLSEQHLATFRERFAGFPYAIAALDRTLGAAEREAVLADVASGRVAVLIGTHALLSDQLRFARLGLLVIDEEHRFGVEQKERLKGLRAGVDVLAMTATPIPRTLQSSLAGLRDLSLLEQPPRERLPIETTVGAWDANLVRTAIRRELARGGQAFVVHDRIGDLGRLAARIARLVPEARLAVLHGRLPAEEVDAALADFAHGRIDALVSTTILESGVDFPNANTLIVDSAHRFGLAQLHQLRGRIGRSDRQSYALLLHPAQATLGDTAMERLRAIAEHAELGAGLRLALRDLEIRGAGNLLGGAQSGHIDAVGFELYAELLDEEVRRQHGAPPRTALPPVDLRLDAFVPRDRVADPALVIAVHRALDAATGDAELAAFGAAFEARFGGPLPVEVTRLVDLRGLRLRAAALGAGRVSRQPDGALRLHDLPPPALAGLRARMPDALADGRDAVLPVPVDAGPEATLAAARRALGAG